MIKALIEHFVKTLATKPDKVQVTVREEQNKTVISIFVAQEDRGRTIGKEGKTIRAIRHCIESVYEDKQFSIDLVDAPL